MLETAHSGGTRQELVPPYGEVVVVSESVCRDVISRQDAFTAVESVFTAMARGDARNFPVVREALGYEKALYGFKSGFDKAGKALGVKSGGYWPNNSARGLTNHQSTIFLFDPNTGRVNALVGGNYLTAVRTAAASAVSIAHLARQDSKVIGILGAGHQSPFQLRAALDQRPFEKIIAWNKSPEALSKLEAVASAAGLPFEAVSRETLGQEADVIISITSAHAPLLLKDWISPGTHIACMGTDTAGKQELDPALFAVAGVFTDEVAQSISIGEAQHAIAMEVLRETDISAIGDVINNQRPGRVTEDQITIFDGTGVGLQDLAVAVAAVGLAQQTGRAETLRLD